jgi:hypothetical protein
MAETAQPSLLHGQHATVIGMDLARPRVISQPRFRREAERLLERVDPDEGPIPHDELVESRASPPDPELSGSPEPVRVRADVLLPLPGRPVRVRLYRDAPAASRPSIPSPRRSTTPTTPWRGWRSTARPSEATVACWPAGRAAAQTSWRPPA